MSMVDDESLENQDKGPIAHQETKVFNSEPYLISVYDNTGKAFVTFELYGLDTQNMLKLVYVYAAFDGLFRFNAELMNPNRKEGRFHWVIERLTIHTIGQEMKLKLGEKPTDEVSQMPLYETVRKIPTGRMDLKERQRLREQMDFLDIKRSQNIAKKRSKTKENFLKQVFALKEEDARRKEEQDRKIEEERADRYKNKEDGEKQEEEEQKALDAKAKARRKAVEVREQRTEEDEEYELAQLRLRWKASDAEKARVIKTARDGRLKSKAEAKEAEAAAKKKKDDSNSKRMSLWKQRDKRVGFREDEWLKTILEKKQAVKRLVESKIDRKIEFVKLLESVRGPVFRIALERTENRKIEKQAEEESVRGYHQLRMVPKKDKSNGKKKAPKKDDKPAKEGKPAKGDKKPAKKASKAERLLKKLGQDTVDRLQDQLKKACSGSGGFKKIFQKFDKDKDGTLDAGELKRLIRSELKISSASLSDKDVDNFVLALDDDGGGKLDPNEIEDFIEKGAATFFAGPEEAAANVEKVLDAVEGKMRAEMEEEKRRAKLEATRETETLKRQEARKTREADRLKDVREKHRKKVAEADRVFEQRRLIMRQKAQERDATTKRKESENERLTRVRGDAIEKKLLAHFAACEG